MASSSSLPIPSRATTRPLAGKSGTVYPILPGVSPFFGVAHSNLANFNSEATQNGVQAPETGLQYEAGVKIATLNDRVMMTAAAFHVMRDNVFALVSDIPVFNDRVRRAARALCNSRSPTVGN